MSDSVNFLGREYDDSPFGAASLYAHAFDPRNIGDVFTDPSPANLAQIGFVPAHGYVASQLIAFAIGERIAWYELLFHNLEMKKQLAKQVAVAAGRSAIITAPVVAAVTGAVVYEKTVNEPIRRSHFGFSSWFGPFASGFGSVLN